MSEELIRETRFGGVVKVEAVGEMSVETTIAEVIGPGFDPNHWNIFMRGPFVEMPLGGYVSDIREALEPHPPDPEGGNDCAFVRLWINDLIFLATPLLSLPSPAWRRNFDFIKGFEPPEELHPMFDRPMVPENKVKLVIRTVENKPLEGLFVFLSVLLVSKEGRPMAELLCGECKTPLAHKNEDYPDYEIAQGKKVKLCPKCATDHLEGHQQLNSEIGEAIEPLLDEEEATGDLLQDVRIAINNGKHADDQLGVVGDYADELLESVKAGEETDIEEVLGKISDMASSEPTPLEDQGEEEEEETEGEDEDKE